MVNGQFLFEDLPVLDLKSFGAVGLELRLEEKEMEVFIYMCAAKVTCGLYYYLKDKLGSKVERKSVMADRSLESLKRVVEWEIFFLLVDVLLEYSHLTKHFDLDISEMLNRLEKKVL